MLYIIAESKAAQKAIRDIIVLLEVPVTEQKLTSDVFPSDFPPRLAEEAVVHAREAAWRPQLATASIEWFGSHRYAVLGTEVWRRQRDGIQSLPYFQNMDRKDNENWDSFVTRAASETLAYLRAFTQRFVGEGDVYINITWVSESEFQNLKST